ncbi:MAG: carbohydrate ABC transporter permease [Anaerolinea sp.]|nr:carbohydrate ABC transporter permease [Anaerolinea sp.]
MKEPNTESSFNQILGRIGFYALIVAIVLFTLFPFYWALNSSFKGEQELFEPASYLPRSFTMINYQSVLSNNAFTQALFNSAWVSGATVLLSLIVGAFAAYALGRLEFKGRTAMMYVVLAMTMFPQISILSGLFAIVTEIGVYGSPLSLILSYPIFTLPFTVWVLTSFFKGLPDEIEQAALVDGATNFQTFYMIMLPLTAPALVTTGLLAFIAAWNEYLYALTFTLTTPASQTVPVAIAQFSGTVMRQEPIAEVMAAAMVVTLPLIVLVIVFQKRIVAGLTAGAVKG